MSTFRHPSHAPIVVIVAVAILRAMFCAVAGSVRAICAIPSAVAGSVRAELDRAHNDLARLGDAVAYAIAPLVVNPFAGRALRPALCAAGAPTTFVGPTFPEALPFVGPMLPETTEPVTPEWKTIRADRKTSEESSLTATKTVRKPRARKSPVPMATAARVTVPAGWESVDTSVPVGPDEVDAFLRAHCPEDMARWDAIFREAEIVLAAD